MLERAINFIKNNKNPIFVFKTLVEYENQKNP